MNISHKAAQVGIRIIFILILASSTAQCMLQNIKGTYDILADDYKHFSLVNGAVAWAGLVRQMYDCGQICPEYKKDPQGRNIIAGYKNSDQEHKIVHLIHALFYRVPGSTSQTDFSTTAQLKYHDPSMIAKTIAKVLALCQSIKANDQAFKNALLNLATHKNLHDAAKKLIENPLIKTRKNRPLWEIFIEQLAMFKKKKSNDYEHILANVSIIRNFCQNLDRIQKLLNGLLKFPASLGDDMGLLVLNSLRECNVLDSESLFPEHTTEMIFLAFIYKKCSSSRIILKTFYDELNKELNNKILVRPLDEKWVNDCFQDINQQTALNTLTTIFNEQDEGVIIRRIDEILFCMQQIHSLPKPVEHTETVYEYDYNKQTKLFPDCMCNAIRNLINILSYDMKKNRFDLSILKKRIQSKSNFFIPKLESFYGTFDSVSQAASQKQHDEWIKVISSIPYAAYVKSPEHVDLANNPIDSKITGYIIIPSRDNANDNLKQFLSTKGYQVLEDHQHGYELMPSVRNIIIVLNHLLNLNLFEKAEHGLAGEFSRNDFVKTYFPKLCKSLNLEDDNYCIEIIQGDDKANLDEVDFTSNAVCSRFIFSGDQTDLPSFTCELITNNYHGGEFFLEGELSNEEENLISLIKDRFSKVHDTSLGLIITNAICKNDINLILPYDSKEILLSIFSAPLEDTTLLAALISRAFKIINTYISKNIHIPLKIKFAVKDLLLRLADKHPDKSYKKTKKLEILNHFINALNNVDLIDCEKNKTFEMMLEAATEGIQHQGYYNNPARLIALKLLRSIFEKNYQLAFKKALQAAIDNINDPDCDIKKGAIGLFESIVKKIIAISPASHDLDDDDDDSNDYIFVDTDVFQTLLKNEQYHELAQKAFEWFAQMATSEIASTTTTANALDLAVIRLDELKTIIPGKVQELIGSLLQSSNVSKPTKERLTQIRDISEMYNWDNELRCPLF